MTQAFTTLYQIAIATTSMFACIFTVILLIPFLGLQQRSFTPVIYAALLLLVVAGILRGVLSWRIGVLAAGWSGFTVLFTGLILFSAGGGAVDGGFLVVSMVAVMSAVPWFAGIGVGALARKAWPHAFNSFRS